MQIFRKTCVCARVPQFRWRAAQNLRASSTKARRVQNVWPTDWLASKRPAQCRVIAFKSAKSNHGLMEFYTLFSASLPQNRNWDPKSCGEISKWAENQKKGFWMCHASLVWKMKSLIRSCLWAISKNASSLAIFKSPFISARKKVGAWVPLFFHVEISSSSDQNLDLWSLGHSMGPC